MAALPALFGLLMAVLVTGQNLDITPREAVRRVGDDLTVLCKVPYAIDACRMTVGAMSYRLIPNNQDEEIVYAGQGLQHGECGAHIKHIKEEWNGNISCTLPPQSGQIEVTGTMRLIVARAPGTPQLLTPPQPTFREGDGFMAQCIVPNGRPAAKITWYLDEVQLLAGIHQHIITQEPGSDLLTIRQNVSRTLAPEDNGQKLVCRAEHEALDAPKEVARQLVVHYPPKRLESGQITIFGLKLGAEGRLNVTVRANPAPTTEWTVGDLVLIPPRSTEDGSVTALEPLHLGGGYYNATLVLARVAKEDVERMYYLRVTNDLGREEFNVRLSTMDEPVGVELDTGAIVGIVIAVLILLIAISLLVFAKATGRWFFAGSRGRDHTKSSGESMPRNRSQGLKVKWTQCDLTRAFKLVDEGTPVREAARSTGIPFSTLQERLKTKNLKFPSMGRNPVFTKDQEDEMANQIKYLGKIFYGCTSNQVRKMAYEYAVKNNLKHNFNENLGMAGRDWLKSFMKRNKLSNRKSEGTSLNRATAFNKDEVDLFFKLLGELMEKYNFLPRNIYNVDETGISSVQDPGVVITEKGQKRVGSITSGERGKNVTVVCAVSATGVYPPPMFIFARQRHSPALENDGPRGAIYRCSKNGWINEELFVDWLKFFANFTKPSETEPILLILDNHCSHISLRSYEFCKKNNIVMLSLPPHGSHRIQPLDVSIYGPFKAAFRQECNLLMKNELGRKITQNDIASLCRKAFQKIATIPNAEAGFAATGIYPLNPDVFTEEDFLAAEVLNSSELAMTLEERRERDDITPDQIIPSTTDLNILSAPDSPSLLSDSTQITPMPTHQTSQSIYDNPVPSISGFQIFYQFQKNLTR